MNSPIYSGAICTAVTIDQESEQSEDDDTGIALLCEQEDSDLPRPATLRLWMNETRYQFSKALPMAIAGTIRSWTSVLELRALGHIGYKQLAGRSLALLVVNLTGYPLMYGFGGALESLCSQAFTNKSANQRIGIYVQHALWLFLAVNIFITLFWLHPDVVFRILAKTDPEVIQYAKTYLRFECIYFPCVIVQTCLKRFILAQGLMRPTIWFELAGLVAMYVSLQLFVPSSGANLGFVGVPCGVSGIASFGFSDLATIAVATLGTQSLAIQAVLNSCKSALSRTGSYLGMVVSNRVGNLIGARNPDKAFLSTKVSVAMVSLVCGVLAIVMLSFQHAIASFITKDRTLILGLLPLLPLLVIVVVFDIVSNVLTGVLRGQGRQGIAAVIRVISLYVIALPLAYVLALYRDLGLYGMWAGLAFGFVLISGAECWLVFASDWNGEVQKSIRRINGSKDRSIVNSHHNEHAPLLNNNQNQAGHMC
ncbi:ethionine resistance protein [Coemansia sp. RSA 1813]|nr:ethionine resistance protein [Coemansia sp. RSA 1646]KAJ1773044.1 ethionine resistance protein [Coemansia sp. RSA 1843]KAJ2092180.1 ethionine resistance protein [Coemansia sp. RSA 986]KAJ2215317.1 ethionine resistance protein [Coemansia sp. RSA 487]KAJ2570347.1 ethionine resistance protein [Coemansia sp. RSA 1813]